MFAARSTMHPYLVPVATERAPTTPPASVSTQEAARSRREAALGDETPLGAAVRRAIQARWGGAPCEVNYQASGRMAVRGLFRLGLYHVEEVTADHLSTLASRWRAEGKAPRTIKRRLTVLRQVRAAQSVGAKEGKQPLQLPGPALPMMPEPTMAPSPPKSMRQPKVDRSGRELKHDRSGRPRPRGSVDLIAPDTGMSRLLEATARRLWTGTRSEHSTRAQASIAVQDLRVHLGVTEAADTTPDHIRTLVNLWIEQGYARGTIRRRLAALNVMGIKVQGCRPRGKPQLKWWLTPDDRVKLLNWLRSEIRPGTPPDRLRLDLADHIEWTCFTGLRVEETLRLRWREVMFHWENGVLVPEKMSMVVPGTKTLGSHATLPLTREAAMVFLRRWHDCAMRQGGPPRPDAMVFPVSYDPLAQLWRKCRAFLGADDSHSATLKALRRVAARHLHVDKGMPLDLVRQYLRHGSISTTMEYLRLTGGYSTEEMRRWSSQ